MHNFDDINVSFINDLINDAIFIKMQFSDRFVFISGTGFPDKG